MTAPWDRQLRLLPRAVAALQPDDQVAAAQRSAFRVPAPSIAPGPEQGTPSSNVLRAPSKYAIVLSRSGLGAGLAPARHPAGISSLLRLIIQGSGTPAGVRQSPSWPSAKLSRYAPLPLPSMAVSDSQAFTIRTYTAADAPELTRL